MTARTETGARRRSVRSTKRPAPTPPARKKVLRRPLRAAHDAVFPPHRVQLPNLVSNRTPKVGTWVRLFPQGGGCVDRAFVVSVRNCDDHGNVVVSFALPDGTQLRQFFRTFRWAHHPSTRRKCPVPALRPLDADEPNPIDYSKCAICREKVRNPFLCPRHWAMYGIRVAPEEGKGLGLQCIRAFEADTPVCPYTGQVVTVDEGKEESVRKMGVSDAFTIEGSVPLSLLTPPILDNPNPRVLHHMGSLANEPSAGQSENAEFVHVSIDKLVKKGVPSYLMSPVYLNTTKPVAAGEFLNLRYALPDQPQWDHQAMTNSCES